ncbi:CSMD3-like protein, partial [Mya arenaria]
CADVPEVPNSAIEGGLLTQYIGGDSVTIVCNPGYTIFGASVVSCQATGQWQTPPVCYKDCPSLDDPTSGTVTVTGYSFDDTATYTCDNDYDIVGSALRTCAITGQWSISAASCVR